MPIRATCMLIGLVLASLAARAEITIDEARTIAEGVAGRELPAEPSFIGDPPAVAVFRARGEAPGQSWMYKVNIREGYFVGWSGPPGDGQPVDEQAALALAKAEATRYLGDAAATLEWETGSAGMEGRIRATGRGPLVGDPPRSGLTPWSESEIDLRTGTIVSYSQTLPTDAEPIEARLTFEEAVEIAKADWGSQDAVVAGTAHPLDQWRGKLKWRVTLDVPSPGGRGGDSQRVVYQIDAVTGEVLARDGLLGGAPPARAPGPGARAGASTAAEAPRSPFPWPSLALGAALLAAGLGVVLLRRRR